MRGSQPWKTNRSRVLRANETSAEDKLWHRLRDRQLGGFKFVRQFPIDRFFADFACRSECLIVEIDGGTHGTPAESAHDLERDERLAALGYKVVRVCNADVYENIEDVLDKLLATLTNRNV